MGSSSSAPAQTITQTQQIPAWEQQEAQDIQQDANNLAATPYPVYQGALVAGQTANQVTGEDLATQAATDYQPYMSAATTGTAANATSGISPTLGLTATNGLTAPSISSAYNGLGQMLDPSSITAAANGGTVNPNSAMAAVGANPGVAASDTAAAAGVQQWNPTTAAQYMDPYVQQSLAPQLLQANTELAQQQNSINAQSTAAGAFGGGRQGAENALQNYHGQQTAAGIEANGMNTAYSDAQTALNNQNTTNLNAYNTGLEGQLAYSQQNLNAFQTALTGSQNQEQMGINAATSAVGASQNAASEYNTAYNSANQAYATQAGVNLNDINSAEQYAQSEQQLGLSAAQQEANLGAENQSLGLTGANAVYNAGAEQQTQNQNELNAAYQQYENQVNWPYQNLSEMESAVSMSPYSMTNSISLPGANNTASSLGAFASLLGGAGAASSSSAPFGGTTWTG